VLHSKDAQVKPTNNANLVVFIQSTSPNRKLSEGQRFLLADPSAKAKAKSTTKPKKKENKHNTEPVEEYQRVVIPTTGPLSFDFVTELSVEGSDPIDMTKVQALFPHVRRFFVDPEYEMPKVPDGAKVIYSEPHNPFITQDFATVEGQFL